MLIRKAFKFRLYPNLAQQQALAAQFGHARFVYNHFLRTRREHYATHREGLRYHDTARMLTTLKRDPEHAWLREADSQVLQQKLKDLERAFVNFFEGCARHPRFKSGRAEQPPRYPQRVKMDLVARRTYLPKVGWIRTVFHRPLEGTIKNVTVSKTRSGRYYAAFQVELEIPAPDPHGEPAGRDLGLSAFAALSDGRKFENPRHVLRAERRSRRLQKSLSRRQKGSAGWERQRQKVARQHERVANQRRDFQHKLSRTLVEEYRLIAIEDLPIRGMVQNRRLAKPISDAGWGQFVGMLAYKGAWYGCDVVTADRWYPSSKTCSACGSETSSLPLHVRTWECPLCGVQHDRDVNAAVNLLKQATVGTTGSHADGVHVRPRRQYNQAGTKKSEAPQLAAG